MNHSLSLLALLFLPGAPVCAPETFGIITRLSGSARVYDRLATSGRPLRLMQWLHVGDLVECDAGSELVVTRFKTAQQYTLPEQGRFEVQGNTITGAQRVTNLPQTTATVVKSLIQKDLPRQEERPTSPPQRLNPKGPGWLKIGETRLSWAPLPSAVRYSFTLIDQNDNIVFAQKTTQPTVAYPKNLPRLKSNHPYLWYLIGYTTTGARLPQTPWGVLTFLSPTDAQQLTKQANLLEQQAAGKPNDPTSLLLLAELYRRYGVLGNALETLRRPELKGLKGISGAREGLYEQLSRYASALRPPLSQQEPEDSKLMSPVGAGYPMGGIK